MLSTAANDLSDHIQGIRIRKFSAFSCDEKKRGRQYVHLARREEQDALAEFGDAYARYEANTPAFFPGFGANSHA